MRKGQRKCNHRFKGIYNQFYPRFKIRIRDGKRYWCTDYQCQIKGCQYWKIDNVGHLLPKKCVKDKQKGTDGGSNGK